MKGQGATLPELQSAGSTSQEDDEQKLLVYLALVGQISQSSAAPTNSMNLGLNNADQRAFLQQQQLLQQDSAMDSMARQILEQAILEQELQALMEGRNYGHRGSNGLSQQQQFSPYMQQQQQQTSPSLQYLSQHHQQQQVQQLAELERLIQLQQMPQSRSHSSWLDLQQQSQNFASQQQRQQLNEEFILSQAIEQARIAQFLQSFHS